MNVQGCYFHIERGIHFSPTLTQKFSISFWNPKAILLLLSEHCCIFPILEGKKDDWVHINSAWIIQLQRPPLARSLSKNCLLAPPRVWLWRPENSTPTLLPLPCLSCTVGSDSNLRPSSNFFQQRYSLTTRIIVLPLGKLKNSLNITFVARANPNPPPKKI